ncbi:Outer membrane receptor proteins, mostly Fe transport [Sphingomonas sp. NFR04]|uniref:TonB-dependent receptor n=1 Tax=Sphingomonas sp. NFR04 TaxID=1566283 RepID=UPI0008E98E4F|nr:TonB-dependent receptor [Sphingomonas sp. NFR04]SFK25727.1 Outer membrane receptor proteins, mostly Fe transport [Sphingomonas sp. NFR04]
MPLNRCVVRSLLLASTMLAAAPALAQQQADAPPPTTDSNDIVVTAQKRSESLQNVPLSIQALSTQKLDELNVSNFTDYVQQLPSVSFQALGGTPGTNVVYMRGVASGGDGNHSGSLPSVGVYLDEQPVTTIGGNLDVHVYDIARIESLSGPQGTLYGASSEAGTIRIITNQPDHKGTYGRVDGEVNTVNKGGVGGKLEGMLNLPINDMAALRLVGFYQHDAGYIDNVAGCRSYLPEPTGTACTATKGGVVVDNKAFVKKDYNDTDLWGGRAALKVDLDENWTVTPAAIYQETRSHGAYGYDPKVGDLQVQHFFPEYRRDRFIQAALTIEGKLGNWDLTYASAYLDRRDTQSSDYTDYAEAYDSLYSSVGGLAGYFYFSDNAGNPIDPRQRIVATDHFKKLSQELRVASPSSERLRLVAGLFYQRQSNDIHQDYRVTGLADDLSVNGHPGTLWLTQQHRVDRDYAAFGEVSYDLTDKLTATAGGRAFIYDNTLIGFFGFGRNPADGFSATPYNGAGSSRTGVAQCFTSDGTRLRDAVAAGGSTTLLPAAVAGGPCTNLAVYARGAGLVPVRAQGQGATYRFNLSWKPVQGILLYGTVSRGFRPGGINRRVDVAPYQADYLTNYELGAKTTWLDGALRLNAAVYQQDWNKFQFSFLGANSFTEIHNGPNARIRGVEADAAFTRGGLSLTAAGSYTDAKTTKNLCLFDDPSFTCAGPDNLVSAPKGTRLPITPQVKLSGSARYTVPVGSAKGYGQATVSHQSSAASDIRTAILQTGTGAIVSPAEQLGRLEAFTTVGLAAGMTFERFNIELFVSNVADERGQLSRFQECGSCGQRTYIVPIAPRTIGIRAGAKF